MGSSIVRRRRRPRWIYRAARFRVGCSTVVDNYGNISGCSMMLAGVSCRRIRLQTMKTLLSLIAIGFLGAIATADAKTFKLPNDDFAIASIDMPDSWKPKEVENGVEGQSADDAVYMSIVAV